MSLPDDVAIRIKNVSKMFQIYARPRDMIFEAIFQRPRHRKFWALRDVSFEVQRGEVVGIIGTNGAGKSTLLKLITGNLDITGGSIETNGEVSAILELGSGFNAEYTGRENIYLGSLVAGLTRKEVDAKIESIIDFSGIRDFIDQPFKTYSSGMQARLVFSLAISQEAEILILDEALAAGDAIFANKSLVRIKEICESDTTVLFVSHATNMVRRFCDRAVWLEKGRIVMVGDAGAVSRAYDRYVAEQSETYLKSQSASASALVAGAADVQATVNNPEFFKYGSKEVCITGFRTVDAEGKPAAVFETGGHLEVQIAYQGRLKDPEEVLHVGCQFHNMKGDDIFTASTRLDCDEPFPVGAQGVFRFTLAPLLLGPGDYFISPAIYAWRGAESRWLDFHDSLYRIKVNNPRRPGQIYALEHPLTWQHEAQAQLSNDGI